jgi:hypothetical protein
MISVFGSNSTSVTYNYQLCEICILITYFKEILYSFCIYFYGNKPATGTSRFEKRARWSARSRANTRSTVKSSLPSNVSLFRVLPLPTPLHSVSPNPRCWYRETRWSASNQRQDPSSSFASSYSWRMRVEGVVLFLSLSLSLSFCSRTRFSRRHLSRTASAGDLTTLIPDSGFTCGNS